MVETCSKNVWGALELKYNKEDNFYKLSIRVEPRKIINFRP